MLNLKCLLRGHQDIMKVDEKDGHPFVRCMRCGRETSGWDRSELPARPVPFGGNADRHRLANKIGA